MEIQHVIVTYDIHDPKRLVRVSKIMKDYGVRVLKSVFECNISEDVFSRMKNRIDGEIEDMEDSVRFYFICGKCIGNVETSGTGKPFHEDEDLAII